MEVLLRRPGRMAHPTVTSKKDGFDRGHVTTEMFSGRIHQELGMLHLLRIRDDLYRHMMMGVMCSF